MLRILLLFVLSTAAWAEALPVKVERLGAWSYLYPLEFYPVGDAMHHRSVSTPTALPFGDTHERLAVIVPGSTKVAEFRAGVFDDLHLSEEWLPLSLAANRAGKLFCLVQHSEKFLAGTNEWKKRWVIGLGGPGWEAAVPIPYEGCDRVEIDSEDRLWALGTDRRVGFFVAGKWTSFTYSDDRKLEFLPLRLSEDASGRVVLFAYDSWPGGGSGTSRLLGTLSYAGGQFNREPKANTKVLTAAEARRYAEPLDQPGVDRAHGYVCHGAALNVGYRGPKTGLRFGGFWVVSLGNEGFVWADVTALAATPPPPSDEWEFFDDITVPPFVDVAGHLTVGRGKQLLNFGATKVEIAEGPMPTTRDNTIDFDPLGRPWVMAWHGSFDGLVSITDHGVLRTYPDLKTALRSESVAFAPGRIFPFALKTPAGLVATGGGYFDVLTVIDAQGAHAFTDNEISPGHKPPRVGHGYNPFRGGEPWMDAEGRIYARVDGVAFVYDSVHRSWSPIKGGKEPSSVLPAVPEEPGDVDGPFTTRIQSPGHPKIVFKGFHFFVVTDAGERQLDSGLNPLAFYPFWTGWYSSPGLTTPRADPSGRLWISALGPYAENRKWYRLRKPAW